MPSPPLRSTDDDMKNHRVLASRRAFIPPPATGADAPRSEAVAGGGIIRGSNSRLERYDDCPSWFKMQYLDKIPAPTVTPLVVGIEFHAFAETYVRHCIEAGVESDFDWGTAKALEFGRNLHEDEAEDAARIIGRFIRDYRVENPADHVGVELGAAFDRDWCEVPWDDRRKVYFRFRLDHVLWERTVGGDEMEGEDSGSRTLVIEDFKSDRVIERHQTVGSSKQLKRYALAAALMWPESIGPEIRVRLFYARFGARRQAVIPAAELPSIRDEIDARMAEIQAERKWEPKAGAHCAFCSYPTRCKLFGEIWGWGPLALGTRGDAEDAARQLMFIRGLEKSYTERLRAWAGANGDMDLGDGSHLGLVPINKVVLNESDKVVEVLKGLGVGEEGCRKALKSTQAGIEAALRTLGRGKAKDLLPEVLEKAGTKDTQIRFQRYKDPEAEAKAAAAAEGEAA
ncbi:MAG: PD-(D/E)XK nuclease family protein [Nitrospirae bacterium]|nr:PD-(D/E)XK nuclease family protein [Nitrospirota bacterium]